MQGMIFAAGLGTRLRPLTNSIPKALVEVGGQTLLYHNIYYLKNAGVTQVIVNLHHHAQQIIDYCKAHPIKGVEIIFSVEENEPLETGGGIKNAQKFLSSDKIIVCNADILTNINLAHMLQLYNSTQAQAVLAVSTRDSSRKLLFDQNMQLKAWQNIQTHEIKNPTGIPIQQLTAWAFAGLHVINTAFIKSWALTGKFSIIDLYLNQCAQHLIIGIDAANHYWWDIGTPQKLKNAQLFFENNK